MRTARIAEEKRKQEEESQVANINVKSSSCQEEYTIEVVVALAAFAW